MKYAELVALLEELDGTSKRLEKTFHIARFLMHAQKDDLPAAVLLLEGKAFPDWDSRKIGVAEQLVVRVIASAAGEEQKRVEKEWKVTGDLGLVAENLLGKKKQATLATTELTVKKVLGNLQQLATMEGQGSVERKLQLIAELLFSASGREARYLVRTILGQLRVGTGAGTLRDAITWAFFPAIEGISDERLTREKKGKSLEISELPDLKELHTFSLIKPSSEKVGRELYNELSALVQSAYDLTNDWAKVVEVAPKGAHALRSIELTLGVPIKVMLAQKADTISEALEMVGVPADAEYKYDGFRIQAHKDGETIRLFTRRLEEVTDQFPDVESALRENVTGASWVLDGEVVGFDPKTKKYLPFQDISQRIRRKYGIEEMRAKFPVELNVFDVIAYNGKTLIDEPYVKRRALVEKIVKPTERLIQPARHIISSDEKELMAFFSESRKAGNEGIMLKSTNAPYRPGSRVGTMVKFKQVMEDLDLVIVGAEWGEGKRSAWLSSFVLACRDGTHFVEVGRVATGLKEKSEEGTSFDELTKLLRPLIIEEDGKSVRIRPKIVIEVAFEEIQKSPSYSSGYALRFPRFVRLRDDRGVNDCSSIDDVERLFKSQKKSNA